MQKTVACCVLCLLFSAILIADDFCPTFKVVGTTYCICTNHRGDLKLNWQTTPHFELIAEIDTQNTQQATFFCIISSH